MKSNTIWALITGLAVGLLIGREWGNHGGGGGGGSGSASRKGKITVPKELPKDWTTEKDMQAEALFKGLTPTERYVALKVMNERPCDCGCPHGSTAKCKKEDPGCPRAPKVLDEVVALAKQGKTPEEILEAVKKPGDGAPGNAGPTPTPPPAGPKKAELAAWTPVIGPKYAKVTIVAYSDFQCPFCSRAVPTMKEIETKYGKDVRIAFRHQPLPFHDHAMEAAEASMAANAQGKFWPMHDKLFANQQALDRASLEKYAGELGLNMAKFKAALDQHVYKSQVETDSKAGTALGASGTPAFFINGRFLSGAQPFDAFKAIIDPELAHADALLKKGTPMAKLYEAILADAAAPAPAAPGQPSAAAPAPPAEHVEVAVGDAPVKGPKNAPVTIIAFSDFQCPFCSRVVPTLKQLEDKYQGKIRVAFKHEPLPFHDKAPLAAEASLAANEQGKFWEMHDKLFANQQALDRPSLEKYAGELGLNMGKFKSALDTGKFKDKVQKDAAEGQKIGASGTPTFFINGYRLVGAQPADAFEKLIDQELAKKK